MIRALFWKEYREQRVIGATLVFLTLSAIAGMYQWKTNEGTGQSQAMNSSALEISLCLAFLCGLVTGAMLLAEEQEARTQAFLDVLPIWRKGLWKGKVVFGLTAILCQVALIGTLNAVLGLIPEHLSIGGCFVLLLGAAVYSFAWGLLGSALCRNVLSAIGLALIGLVAAGLVGGVLVALLEALIFGGVGRENPLGVIAAAAVMLVPLPLIGSRMAYAATDYRGATRTSVLPIVARMTKRVRTWRVMLWLVWRQGRTPFFILALVSILGGFLVRADVLVIWPIVSLLVGMVCGLAAFMGEQGAGSELFLGTERVPASRFWLYKLGLWFVVLLFLSGLFWIVPALRFAAWTSTTGYGETRQHGFLAGFMGTSPQVLSLLDVGTFAGLWLLHGFAIGQVFAMACRKTVVAGFLSIGACLTLGALWLPSVLFGGLHFWQIVGAPVILLVGSRLAYWPWIGNRLLSWRPLTSLIACGVLAGTWIAGQLVYRVLEIPAAPKPLNVASFLTSLPTAEKNLAGRTLKIAGEELRLLVNRESPKMGPSTPGQDQIHRDSQASNGAIYPSSLRMNLDQEVLEVSAKGWGDARKNHQELGQWLDRLFQERWLKSAQDVRAASELPLAMLIDPTSPPRDIKYQATMDIYWIANVFLARGRQFQAREEYQQAWEHYYHVLALSRHMRSRALLFGFQYGLAIEDTTLKAIDSWLNELSRSRKLSASERVILIREVLEALKGHDTALPSLQDSLLAEFLVIRNSIYDPETFNDRYGAEARSAALSLAGKIRLLAILPWEMNRMDRLLEALFAGWQRTLALDYPHLIALLREGSPGDSGPYRSNMAGRFLLVGWSPPDEDPNGKQSRNRLAALINQSWLRDVLALPVDHLAVTVLDQIGGLRHLRIKMAIEGYRLSHAKGNDPDTLNALVPEYLENIPLDPHTNLAYSLTDIRTGTKSEAEEKPAGKPGGRPPQ